MNKLKIFTIIFLTVLFQANAQSEKNSNKLKEEFRNPGMRYRMNVNRHHVPQTLTGQDELIDYIIDNGYGGMATNVDGRNYLKSQKEFELFRRMVYTAKAKGLDLWLYDEKLYPSGMADTYILDEHPEWEAEGLFFKSTTVRGSRITDIETIPGNPVVTAAVQVKKGIPNFQRPVDISSSVQDGKIKWKASAGEWIIIQINRSVLYEGFQAGTDRHGQIPRYPSLLMPEVTERFIELTHKEYAKIFREKLGDIFTSTFTDEPSSMALTYVDPGYGVYPWKENVSIEFKKRYGSELKDKLIVMMLDEGYEGQKIRYQYFQIISDFMSGNYFRKIREYCATQNLKSGGHLLVEETMMAHAPLYGSIMACFREMDVPGIDVLTGMPSFTRRYLYSSRLASSAAELEGNDMVMTESCPISEYSIYDGKEAPTVQVRGSLNRQIVGGVTDFNNYLQLQHEQPEGRKLFNDYIARIILMTQGGIRASRIAVYYPIETLWTKYRPLPSGLESWDNVAGGDPEAQRVSGLFDAVSDCMYDNGWEFSYVDTKAIEDSKTENGKLIHGSHSWEVIIFPATETISEKAMQRLADFTKSGGKVVFLEDLPTNSFTEFPSKKIAGYLSDMQKSGSVTIEKKYNQVQLNRILERSLKRDIILDNYKDVLYSHKIINGNNIYFVTNDTEINLDLKLNIPSANTLEIWDPMTGEIKNIDTGNTLISLAPYGGIIIRH